MAVTQNNIAKTSIFSGQKLAKMQEIVFQKSMGELFPPMFGDFIGA